MKIIQKNFNGSEIMTFQLIYRFLPGSMKYVTLWALGSANVLPFCVDTSRKHLRTKVTSDFHLTCSKKGEIWGRNQNGEK